nr:uncharacterized protein LOC111518017 [Leptinotarsa decemlineata]
MKYVQREMANVSSLEEYAAYQSTDYCQCCISPKKKAAEPAAVEPRRKRNKPLVPEDPVNDPIKDDSTTPTPPPVVATPSSATIASALENVSTPPPAKAPKALQKGGPRRKGHVPANAAFRAVGPGHTPRPRIQVVQQEQAYVMSSSDFRTIYLYEYKLNQSAAKTAQKINEAFGNGSVNERTVRRWFAKFRSGDFSLEDEPRSGRPTVIQDEALRSLMETDPSQTVRGMAKELGVSPHAVFDGLNRIGKRSSDLRRSAPSAQTFLR